MTGEWRELDAKRQRDPSQRPSVRVSRAYDVQIAQLMQALGLLGARSGDAGARDMVMRQAVPRMRELIPKDCGFSEEARAGAVWALGLLHEQSPDAALGELFRQRLADNNPTFPEAIAVRRAGAVSVGRMRFGGAVNTLEQYYREEKYTADIAGACGWAIERITGEKRLPLPTIESTQSGWFLQPID
jgi:hypothetical protein